MEKNTCTLNDVLILFSKLFKSHKRLNQSWGTVQSSINKFIHYYQKTEKILNHIHKNHNHVLFHKPNTINVGKSGHSTLAFDDFQHNYNLDCMNELYTNSDINHDGEIYGYDFIYEPNSINTPRIFRECIETIRYIHNYKQKFDKILDYTYQNREILTPETEIIREIIMGCGPICKDFIIDPDDNETPKEIKILQQEYCRSTLPNKEKLSWNQIRNIYEQIVPKEIYTGDTDSDNNETNENVSKQNKSSYICTRLMAELVFNKDVDGNGLILGKDFVFANYDNENLKCMYCIENSRLCCNFDDPDLRELTWEQFIETFPGNEPDDRKR